MKTCKNKYNFTENSPEPLMCRAPYLKEKGFRTKMKKHLVISVKVKRLHSEAAEGPSVIHTTSYAFVM